MNLGGATSDRSSEIKRPTDQLPKATTVNLLYVLLSLRNPETGRLGDCLSTVGSSMLAALLHRYCGSEAGRSERCRQFSQSDPQIVFVKGVFRHAYRLLASLSSEIRYSPNARRSEVFHRL